MTPETRMHSQPRLLFVHGSVVNADLTWSAQKPLGDRFEIVAPNRRGFPPGPEVESVDFEDEAAWLEPFLEPRSAPRRAFVRRRDRAARRGAPPGARALADRGRAARLRRRARNPRGRRVHGADRRRTGRRARDDPAAFLRGFLALGRLVHPARRVHARASAGRADADGRAPAVGGGDPVRRAGARAVPEARRLGRAQRRRSRRSATCSRSGSAPSEPFSPAPATRCSGSASRSTSSWRASSSAPRPR